MKSRLHRPNPTPHRVVTPDLVELPPPREPCIWNLNGKDRRARANNKDNKGGESTGEAKTNKIKGGDEPPAPARAHTRGRKPVIKQI
ncbi:unnamed protein product [Brassica rapa subsp. narinosa]